jgi:amidase
MNLEEYTKHDGLGLAELIREREVTASELARLAVAAVDALNPKLNAVIEVYRDRVVAADRRLNTDAPFAGVPFLMKDSGSAEAGQLQELGSRLAKGRVVHREDYLAKRFRAAGLTILGRTAIPEMALASTTESVLTGITRNPWNLALSTGGSTGGGAAAIAAGIVPVAHGSDRGGSVRAPAALCGLVGLKPSRGRVTCGPSADEEYFGMTQEFILSRTVRDTAAMLDAVGKPAVGDPFIIVQPSRPYLEEVKAPLPPKRIAFTTTSWHGGTTDPEMVQAVEDVVGRCEELGHIVEETAPVFDIEDYLREVSLMRAGMLANSVDAISEQMGRPIDAEHLEHVTLEWYRIGKQITVSDLMRALGYYNKIRRQVGEFFEQYDLLLTPSAAGPATPLGIVHLDQDISYWEWIEMLYAGASFTELFNITGQPAISLPLAWNSENLPLGVQFVARFGDEASLIRLAGAFEEVVPWKDRVPPVHAGSCGAARALDSS